MINTTFRRQHRRFKPKKELNFQINFNYMGKTMNASIEDISNDGIGFIINKEPFSIIDYEIIDLNISTTLKEFKVPSRILYSQKLGTSGRKRRYGVHFLSTDLRNIESFINKNCSKKSREER